jgi:hypothetical protein
MLDSMLTKEEGKRDESYTSSERKKKRTSKMKGAFLMRDSPRICEW